MTDKLTPVDLSKFRVMLNGEEIREGDWIKPWTEIDNIIPVDVNIGERVRIANVFYRPIKGSNVNITIDDGKLPEIDILGSMHKFDTEKVTGEIVGMLREYWDNNDGFLKGSDFNCYFKPEIHSILEANLADERNEAHVCKCNVKED